MITAAELEALLADLVPIGLDETGATTRLAWTDEDEQAAAWFARRAPAIGRRLERDPAGNLWACPDAPAPWWAIGSHPRHRAFRRALRRRARRRRRLRARRAPAGGGRFLRRRGGRALQHADVRLARAGRAARRRRALARRGRPRGHARDAMAGAGVDPAGLAGAPGWLERLRGFLELHIDQTRDVAAARRPAGVVTRLAARCGCRSAQAAPTTPAPPHARSARRARRSGPRDRARGRRGRAAARHGLHRRPAGGRAQLADHRPLAGAPVARARAPEAEAVESWREAVQAEIERVAAEAGVEPSVRTAAWSPGTEFGADVIEALGHALRPGAPRLVCYAGHDAGMIAGHRPARMVLVRNETGISHSPDEDVSLEDAAVAANGLLAAAEELAR